VLPNEDAAGYYRASASIEVLRRLLGPARDKLTAVERAALLEDAAARTGAGTLSLGDALSLVPPIVKSGGRVELTDAYALLGAARPDALPADLRKRYAHFLASTYGTRARALGWKPRPSDTPDDLVLRPQMLGLLGGPGEDAAVRKEAHALALKWLDDRASLRPELVRVALGLAGRSNDRALFERLRAAARAAQDHRERGELLGALGGFTDPTLAREALSLLLSGDVDLRESTGILWHALSTLETREVAYRFLESNFDVLVARMRSDEASGLFRVPSFFCDEEHRADAAAFFGPRAEKIDGAPRALATALEEVRVCVEASKLNRGSVEAFLAHY
jgi:aminopeptidase N